MREYNIAIVILRINKIVYIYDDYVTIYLSFVHIDKFNKNHIYQLNSINIVITTPGALNRWSHINQFCNSD